MKLALALLTSIFVLLGCSNESTPKATESVDYFDHSGRTDILSGGIKDDPG